MQLEPSRPIQSFWPARWWWGVLLVLVVVAAGLRYPGYDFSLPYIDHVDEPAYNIAGRMIIDSGSAKPIGMHGYPPGIVTINYVLLRLLHDPPEPPGAVIGYVRLISITFSLGIVALIALLGYRVATPVSGLLAAGMWVFTPVVLEHSRYATADNFVTFFTLLALFLMISGTLYNRDRLTTHAIVAAMFAVVFKYQAGFVLPLILVGPLWRLRTAAGDREQVRAVLTNFAANGFYLGIFFFWLVLIYPATEATSSPDWSAPTERLSIPSLDIVRHNIRVTLEPLRDLLVWAVGGAGLLLLAWPRFRRQTNVFGLGMLLAGALLWCTGVSFYGMQFFRQFIAAGALAVLLVGVGLSAWIVALETAVERLNRPKRISRPALLSAVPIAVLVLGAFWPQINDSLDNAREHTLPDRRNDLARYMDRSLAPGPYIGSEDNHKTFNGAWGGYAGQHEFPLFEIALVDERPLEEWRALGVEYAIVPHWTYDMMQATPEGRATLDGMLKLKDYPPSDDYRGPAMIVYRLDPIQHTAEQPSLGPVRLIGYDIDQTALTPGESLTFVLYWQASAAAAVDYVVYNHLTPLDSREIVAQVDGPPYADMRRTTRDWTDPDEVLVSQPFTLTVGEDTPPGDYRLITGFYRRDTFERLTTPDGADYVLVSDIRVVDPGESTITTGATP